MSVTAVSVAVGIAVVAVAVVSIVILHAHLFLAERAMRIVVVMRAMCPFDALTLSDNLALVAVATRLKFAIVAAMMRCV